MDIPLLDVHWRPAGTQLWLAPSDCLVHMVPNHLIEGPAPSLIELCLTPSKSNLEAIIRVDDEAVAGSVEGLITSLPRGNQVYSLLSISSRERAQPLIAAVRMKRTVVIHINVYDQESSLPACTVSLLEASYSMSGGAELSPKLHQQTVKSLLRSLHRLAGPTQVIEFSIAVEPQPGGFRLNTVRTK